MAFRSFGFSVKIEPTFLNRVMWRLYSLPLRARIARHDFLRWAYIELPCKLVLELKCFSYRMRVKLYGEGHGN